MGKQLVVALASAVRPLRKPGADTVRQMPGFFVRYPAMAAALPAFCSWRNEMTRMPAAWAMRPRSVIGIPGTLEMGLMPVGLSAAVTRVKPSVSCCSASAAVASGFVLVAASAMGVLLGRDDGLRGRAGHDREACPAFFHSVQIVGIARHVVGKAEGVFAHQGFGALGDARL